MLSTNATVDNLVPKPPPPRSDSVSFAAPLNRLPAEDEQIWPALDTLQPFPPGTLISLAPDGASSVPANEAMRQFLRLRQRLKELQHRLGTPFETCADLDEARDITHALWNYVQIRWMWSYLGSGRLPGGLLGHDHPRGDAV